MVDSFTPSPNEGAFVNPVHLHANLDESGKFKDKDTICLAGIISHPENLKVINGHWVQGLRHRDIDYLHVSELMRWDGIYNPKKDKWGTDGRSEVLNQFAKVVNLSMSHRPSLVVFEVFIAGLVGLGLRLFAKDFTLGLTCDEDEEMILPMCRLLRRARAEIPEIGQRIKSICFADDQFYLPLQLADLLAYACSTELNRRRLYPDMPQDSLYGTAVKEADLFLSHLTGDKLRQIAKLPHPKTLTLVWQVGSPPVA
jgi:hypothetical protein